jgi:hypothetical protein
MTRHRSFMLAAVLLLLTQCVSTINGQSAPLEVPKAATVEVSLLKAPGIDDEGSRWEIAYEFRIANDKTMFDERKKMFEGSAERVGELIKEGSIKRSLRSPEGRRVVFQIPFSPEIQERLRGHPRNQLKVTSGNLTPADARLADELEKRSQTFLFYTIISVYDSKLKKNILIATSRTWSFGGFPESRFEIKVEINSDGSYSVNSSSRKDALRLTRESRP